jgi:mRNA interferase RelE/StbE
MKTYKIEFRPSAKKQLSGLESVARQRIHGAIELLKTDPIPPGAKRLRGRNDYRIRVGDYRVIYSLRAGKLIILIVAIGHRRDVYLKSE